MMELTTGKGVGGRGAWRGSYGLAGAFLGVALLVGPAFAEPKPDFEAYARAIYWAEGGEMTSHPYGIMTKYKHTTPREACLNTIRHKYADWVAGGSRGRFIDYLGSKYAPTEGATNDPQGLNKNWIHNVEYYLGRQA